MIQELCNIGNEHLIDTFYKVAILEATQLEMFNHLTPDDTIQSILDTIPDSHQVLITDLLPDSISVSNPAKLSESGVTNTTSISFVVTPQDKNLQTLLNTYQNQEVVALVSKRGTSHLYGTQAQPLLFKFSELNNPKPNGLKGYTISISGTGYGDTKIFEAIEFTIYNKGLAFQLAEPL